MSVRNNAVNLNNGGTLNLGTYGYGTPGSFIDNIYYMEEGSQPPTIMGLRQFPVKELVIADAHYTSLSNLLFGGVSEETLATDEWKDAKEEFSRYAYFIWGDLESGGAYIRRTGQNMFVIGGISGFYKNTDYNTYYYSMSEANRSYSWATVNDLCFMYDSDWVNLSNPVIRVFCMDGLTTTDYWYHAYSEAYIGTTYGTEQLTSMSQVVLNNEWVTILTPPSTVPKSFWYPRPNVVPPMGQSYEILGDREQNPILVRISGDVWGGQSFNPDPEDNPTEGGGDSSASGGYGGYSSDTGNIGNSNPAGDSVNVINSGFMSLFNPTTGQVKGLSNWLFDNGTFTDIMANSVKRLIADPMDFILFLALCRVTPPSSVQKTIKFAGVSTGITANYINNQFVDVNCGNVTIDLKKLTGTFLDYNPNTKIQLFLPYIGIVSLDTDSVVNATINILYHCDLMSGSCVAQVKVTRGIRREGDTELNDVLYTFQGNIFEIVPITATDWRGAVSSMIQGISGGLQLASGNAGGVSTMAQAVMSDKVSVSHSGTLAGSYGYMDNQTPYIIISRPINANPSKYGEWRGYTSNIRAKIGSLSGYTEIVPETLWLGTKTGGDFSSILKEEAEMLKSIVSSGFYV